MIGYMTLNIAVLSALVLQNEAGKSVSENSDLVAKLVASINDGDGKELSKNGFSLSFESSWLKAEHGPVDYKFIDRKLKGCVVDETEIELDSFVIDWKCNRRASFLPADKPNDEFPKRCFDESFFLVGFYWTETPKLILRHNTVWSVKRCGPMPVVRPPVPQ